MKVYLSCFELSQKHPYTLLIVMHKMEETNFFKFIFTKRTKIFFSLKLAYHEVYFKCSMV